MSSNSIKGTSCFSIGGEWLTDHVRSLWSQEDKADHALTILQAAFPEMSYDQKLSILEGRNKLTGNSNVGMDLVSEEHDLNLPTFKDTIKRLTSERDEARDNRADLIELMVDDTVAMGSPTGKRLVPRRKTEGFNHSRRLKQGYEWPD